MIDFPNWTEFTDTIAIEHVAMLSGFIQNLVLPFISFTPTYVRDLGLVGMI
jgi:hypothetical protein